MNIPVETRIKLNKFSPRKYQVPVGDALENKGYKRILSIWPRRAGKDVTCFNLLIRSALRKVGTYFYCLPTFAHARKVIWNGILDDGTRFMDFIPKDLISAENSSEMVVRLKNGSSIQLVGADNYDSLVGTNPLGIVFSEYSLTDGRSWGFLRPILAANDGFALFNSTPRGHNALYSLYNMALESPDWFVYRLTFDDTRHISENNMAIERKEMSEDMFKQEYMTDFDKGQEGAYYGKYVDRMRIDSRICDVPYEAAFKVHTAWDLGMDDFTAIIFWQNIGMTTRIIDYYENKDQGLEFYSKILNQKEYNYGTHIAPHDIMVRELGTGISRLEKARQLGIRFTVAPNQTIEDGVEAVRSMFSRLWIDQVKCAKLIKCLENYRHEYDSKTDSYKDRPLHDWSSHGADAARYMAISLHKTNPQTSPEALERRYQETIYGVQSNMPAIFRDDLP